MLAKQVSKNAEIFCTAETPLAEVFNKMNELGCAWMPVVESLSHRNLIGVVTEHDICMKLINGGLNPQRASAGRVMSGKFTTVTGEASLEECAALLMFEGIERLFVVDDDGALTGILTARDLETKKAAFNLETVIRDFRGAQSLPAKRHLVY